MGDALSVCVSDGAEQSGELPKKQIVEKVNGRVVKPQRFVTKCNAISIVLSDKVVQQSAKM
jgi:hypothetical protein